MLPVSFFGLYLWHKHPLLSLPAPKLSLVGLNPSHNSSKPPHNSLNSPHNSSKPPHNSLNASHNSLKLPHNSFYPSHNSLKPPHNSPKTPHVALKLTYINFFLSVNFPGVICNALIYSGKYSVLGCLLLCLPANLLCAPLSIPNTIDSLIPSPKHNSSHLPVRCCHLLGFCLLISAYCWNAFRFVYAFAANIHPYYVFCM